jgi:hypothetical protein
MVLSLCGGASAFGDRTGVSHDSWTWYDQFGECSVDRGYPFKADAGYLGAKVIGFQWTFNGFWGIQCESAWTYNAPPAEYWGKFCDDDSSGAGAIHFTQARHQWWIQSSGAYLERWNDSPVLDVG